MANAISKRHYQLIAATTRTVMTVLGLVLVSMLLIAVTKSKFDVLKSKFDLQNGSIVTAAERTKQLDCLSRNIYWEAASESFEGKVAVAQVTLNRVDDGRFGKDVCGVVFQKNVIYEKIICQFSWVCEQTARTKPIHPKLYAESEEVAKKVLLENFRLPGLTAAMYYHATYIDPKWNRKKITTIGQHIFYE